MSSWWRWRYLPPNVLTSVSLMVAFISISESIAGRFVSAAWLLLLCALLDKADGFVARLFNASSRFGVELDSLADLVAFGLAPAVMTLSFLAGQGATHDLAAVRYYRYLVFAGTFFFVLAAALRLAKFNVTTEDYGNGYFFGLPTTLCGAMVGCYFLAVLKYQLRPEYIQALPIIMIVLGLMMVSRIPLPKPGPGKSIAFNIVLVLAVVVVYAFGLMRIYPEFLLAFAIGYALVGSVVSMARGIKPPKPSADDAQYA